jgi:hypothetical protein
VREATVKGMETGVLLTCRKARQSFGNALCAGDAHAVLCCAMQARYARQVLRAFVLSELPFVKSLWGGAAQALVERRTSNARRGDAQGARADGQDGPKSMAFERFKFWLGIPNDYYSSE